MTHNDQHPGAGHRQRLRDKFLASGLSGFHDYEIIELLLTLATPRKDCKPAAKAAIKRFKTLAGVLDADSKELCEIEGIGPKNLLGIRLVKAVAERYLERQLTERDVIQNAKELFNYLRLRHGGARRERFDVLYLDAKNRVLGGETLFEGTLTQSAVYPRAVVEAALSHKAAALIFAHNHPSGDPNPSRDDVAVTRELVFACRMVDITVHEHLIIGEDRYFSFADEGYIKEMNRQFDRTQERRKRIAE